MCLTLLSSMAVTVHLPRRDVFPCAPSALSGAGEQADANTARKETNSLTLSPSQPRANDPLATARDQDCPIRFGDSLHRVIERIGQFPVQ